MTLRVRIPPGALTLHDDEPDGRRVTLDGASLTVIPGQPELPVVVAGIGVPEGATLRWSYRISGEQAFRGSAVRAVARHDRRRGRWLREPDAAIYDGEDPWPPEPVSLKEARFRGLRLARVLFWPVRFHPRSGELLVAESVEVRIDFDGETASSLSPERGPVERRLLERVLLNGATLQSLSSPVPRTVPGGGMSPRTHSLEPPDGRQEATAAVNPGVKIRVAQEGLVRIDVADLAAIGFTAGGVNPRNLELSHRGLPVPCRMLGESDGSLDAGDALEFYGTPGTGRYSRENVYWLEEGSTPGTRFPSRAVVPGSPPTEPTFVHTEHIEDGNGIYTFGNPAAEGDPHFFWSWFEDNPNPPRVTSLVHQAPLDGLATSGGGAVFRALFSGQTDPAGDPDHRVKFLVNGVEVGHSTWSGLGFHLAEVPFDSTLLNGGANLFRIDYDFVVFPDRYYLDWFEIDYLRSTGAANDRLWIRGGPADPARYLVTGLSSVQDALVLDVTDPLSPVQLTDVTVGGSGPFTVAFEDGAPAGRRFFVTGDAGRVAAAGLELDVPSQLRDPANGADLIVVVPDGWTGAVGPLVAHRQAEGLRVAVAELSQVADEFAGGNVDDVAIRDFVAYAYESWQAPPVSSLLLVGEPNLDALNDLELSPFHHFMPTHFAVTSGWGETVSDTWFGAVSGEDLLPDVSVGRFSVRSPQEAGDLAAKVVAYETGAPTGSAWTGNVLLIASNDPQFESSLDGAVLALPPHFTVQREYRRLGATTASILEGFDAGAVMASFFGHGNVTSWGDAPGLFFSVPDAAAVDNVGLLPFLTAANCLNGLIGNPYLVDSLSEVFHAPADRGALAVWSPSSYGYLGTFDALQSILYRVLFQDGVPYLGEATTAALVETFLTTPAPEDLLKEMVLLGDPAGWLAIDVDEDGLVDAEELYGALDPHDRDSDDDGLLDGLEGGSGTDTDGDGMSNPLDPDADQDGLPDGLEAGIREPDPDTDTSAGFFRADADPSSTTDPLVSDTDGGGAFDGAEDRNGNGAVDDGETDPRLPGDDPVCGSGPPSEIGTLAGDRLELSRSGEDLVLTWGDASAQDPCMLYHVYVSEDLDGATDRDGFRLLAVTNLPALTHRGAAVAPTPRRYLIAGANPSGEGPWGHFEP